MLYSYVTWGGNIALLLLIFIRARSHGMLRRYRVFYAYVCFALVTLSGTVPVAVFFGMKSQEYYYAYHLTNLFVPLFQLWILWDIYRRIVGNDKIPSKDLFHSVTLLALMTVPVLWGVSSLGSGDFFYRYHLVTLAMQVVTCLLVYRKAGLRADLDLGRNLKGMLFGLSLMVALQVVNFSRFLFREEAYRNFAFFVPFIYFLALIVFAYTLWSYEPIFERKSVAWGEGGVTSQRLAKINEQVQQALKSLLLPR